MKKNTYNGLLKLDHSNKKIYINRQLNPPSHNARFVDKIKKEYPNYEIVKKY